ncbi:MAG: zf-HC2 domain-containing protein [Blastocatellia bacterium]
MFSNHVTKQLSAYCHDELPAEESARVGAHLHDCRRCREEHELIQRGVALALQLSREQAPVSLWSDIASALDEPQRRSWFAIPAYQFATVCALSLLLVCVGVFWAYLRRVQPDPPIARFENPAWDVSRIEGQPQVGERRIAESDRMAIGEWLVTDDASRAEIRVGEIGQVQIEPGSRVRLVEAKTDNHRLALARGKMQALIWAPPRQFFVDTPSAVAVDLGCAYTLEVNEEGQGLLHVIAGWVAFEWQGRESFVPAGAECITRPGRGPGTPFFSDAGQKFQNGLAIFDVAARGSDASSVALRSVLARARKRDGLTLWHLLARAEGDDRGRVYDRLAELIPPPPQVTKENVLGGNRDALDLWWEKLELGSAEWWRLWKGPMPSSSK